jgi:hypothetical protein
MKREMGERMAFCGQVGRNKAEETSDAYRSGCVQELRAGLKKKIDFVFVPLVGAGSERAQLVTMAHQKSRWTWTDGSCFQAGTSGALVDGVYPDGGDAWARA